MCTNLQSVLFDATCMYYETVYSHKNHNIIELGDLYRCSNNCLTHTFCHYRGLSFQNLPFCAYNIYSRNKSGPVRAFVSADILLLTYFLFRTAMRDRLIARRHNRNETVPHGCLVTTLCTLCDLDHLT